MLLDRPDPISPPASPQAAPENGCQAVFEKVIREILHGTSASVGEEFFQVLVRHLVRASGADYAFIGELIGPRASRVRTIAVCQGEQPMGNFEFILAGTPCEEVVAKGLCTFASGVRDSFPLDHLAAQMGVESYVGISLLDSAGTTLGPMALLGRKPLDMPELAERLLRIFAARAAAELERRRGERTQKEQLHFTQTLLDALPNPIFYKDIHGRYLGCNQAFEELVGLERGRLIGRTVLNTLNERNAALHHQEDLALLQEKTARDYGLCLEDNDGPAQHFVVRKAPFFSSEGSLGGLIGTIIDITAHKQAEQEIRQLAYFDTLTGLPNRTLLKDRLEQALVFARRDQRPVGLLMLDIDRFKGVNDSHGHTMGDQLLQAVAGRLREMVRTSDTVARPGGDEFMILLPAVAHEQDIAHVARKIKDTLHPPFSIGGQKIFITTSIGIAVFPPDGQDADILLRNADTAMYVAKEQGKNRYQFFSPEMNDQAVARVTLETNLRQGIERGEFSLDYQPQIDLATGVITGVEALLRWHHPQNGTIAPSDFIPTAEETGLILPLGEWVLRTACRQAKEWHLAGFSSLRMAVNLSALQFCQSNLLEMVSDILQETKLPPQILELEITESVLMENAKDARGTLKGLKELGVMLAIDDFGTGYSSLSYLKHFPIDRLKIDQSFVRDLATHCDDTAIVDAIIALGHSLRLSIIAEGVENEQQLQVLREGRCHEMQGYYFSRPLSAESCSHLFAEGLTTGALRLVPFRSN